MTHMDESSRGEGSDEVHSGTPSGGIPYTVKKGYLSVVPHAHRRSSTNFVSRVASSRRSQASIP
jgi:hypothetical protein